MFIFDNIAHLLKKEISRTYISEKTTQHQSHTQEDERHAYDGTDDCHCQHGTNDE